MHYFNAVGSGNDDTPIVVEVGNDTTELRIVTGNGDGVTDNLHELTPA